MKENCFWITLWLGLVLFLLLLTNSLLYFDKTKTIEMAKLGYEKVTIPGNNRPVYQKRGEKSN